MNTIEEYKEKTFEDIKHIDVNGNEYWSARDLMPLLEYSKCEHFHKVIKKAIITCENSNNTVSEHFPDVGKVLKVGNVNYILLTDLAKYQNSSDPSFTVKNWLRRIATIDYIGLWEELHNNNFNLVEFDQIKTEYGKNSFAMSPS